MSTDTEEKAGNTAASNKTRKTGKRRMSRRDREKRRALLLSMLAGGAVVGLSLTGYYPIITYARAENRLRPPGAIEEKEFLAACIKCGQCVQVCPVEAIILADIEDGFGNGAPYIIARDQACDFSCDATQCILACPTGALSHEIDKKEQVRMGLAVLKRPDTCLARQGLGFKGLARGPDFKGLHRYVEVDRWNPIPVAEHPYDLEICDLCVRECPIKGAIELRPMSDDPNDKRRTPVVTEKCVGCGMCEMICPVEPPCIVVEPRLTYEEASRG
jgi:ferredoxin-type protein NapG